MNNDFGKIAIICGSGDLPIELAQFCQNNNYDFILSRINGISDNKLSSYAGHDFGLGEFGKRFAALKKDNVNTIILAGYVKRPEFSKIGLDAYGLGLLPKMISEGRKGDDALLRLLISEFEKNGFRVIGADELQNNLKSTKGILGNISPNIDDLNDIKFAIHVVETIGKLDIGQGAVICNGLTLAVEAQEGTDEMLRRIPNLPENIRGTINNPRGILLKLPKPIQEMRVDLPVIGLDTIENAHKAFLKGIAIRDGQALILDKDNLIKRANELGIFIYGIDVNDEIGG